MSNVSYLGDSSNGRTSDSGSGSAGSTPASPAINLILLNYERFPYASRSGFSAN